MLINQRYISSPFDTLSVKRKLSGTVNSGNSARNTVLVYDRINGVLLGTTNPDESTGYWEIFLAIRADEELMCICRDEGGDFNADIYDRISLCTEDYAHEIVFDSLILPSDNLLYAYEGAVPSHQLVAFPYTSTEQNLKNNISILRSVSPFYEAVFLDAGGVEVTFGPGGAVPEIVPGAYVADRSGITGYGSVLLEGRMGRSIQNPDIFGDGSDFYTVDFCNDSLEDRSGGAVPFIDSGWILADGVNHSRGLQKTDWDSYFYTGIHMDSSNDWTVSFWMRFDGAQNTNYNSLLLYQRYGLWLTMRPTSRLMYLRTGNGAGWNTNTAIYYPTSYGTGTGYWLHLTLVLTSTEKKLYMDGVLLGTFADTGITSNLTEQFMFGGESSSSDEAKMTIAMVRIFNRGVTDAEVVTLYEDHTPGDVTVETIRGSRLSDNLFKIAGVAKNPVHTYTLRGHWSSESEESFDGWVKGVSIASDSLRFSGTNGVHKAATCAGDGSGLNSVGDESAVELICRFMPYEKGGGAIQTLYKSGDGTNGIALAIDASDNLGIYGRSGGVLASLLIPPSNYDVDMWYTLHGTATALTLYDDGLNEVAQVSGTATAGDGTGQESVGGSCEGSPISATTDIEPFTGRISDVQVVQSGTGELTFPSELRLACEIGETGVEAFVEVAKWDIKNNVIELHVKIPTLPDNAETLLRFYFAPNHASNTTYVGNTGDAAAQQVWDSNYVAVYHMEVDGATLLDSTANGLNLSITGGTTIAGLLANAVDFNGSSDFGTVADAAFEITAGGLTYEAVLKRSAQTPGIGTLSTKGQAGSNLGAFFGISANSDEIQFGTLTDYISGGNITTDEWTSIAGTWDGSANSAGLALYVSGIALSTTVTGAFAGFGASGMPFVIGAESDDGTMGNFLYGGVDELRISNIQRSAAWLALVAKSNQDDLISFSGSADGTLLTWKNSPVMIVTVDGSKIIGDLVDFPIRIPIGPSVGLNSFDNTKIIQELSVDFSGHEDFSGSDGDTLDLGRWGEISEPEVFFIEGNRLRIHRLSGVVGGNGGSVRSIFRVGGDFDIEIEFEVVDCTGNQSFAALKISGDNVVGSYSFIALARSSIGDAYWMRIQQPGTACCHDKHVARSYSTGRVRFTRIGTELYAWKWDGGDSGWVLLWNQPFNDVNCSVSFDLWRSSTSYTTDHYFDNLKVNAGEIIGGGEDNYLRMALEHVRTGKQCYCEVSTWSPEIEYTREWSGSDYRKDVVMASHMYSASYSAEFGFNGIIYAGDSWISTDTCFDTATGDAIRYVWYQWDLETAKKIAGIKLLKESAAQGTRNIPKQVQIYGSDSPDFLGEESLIGYGTYTEVGADEWTEYITTNTKLSFRYVRIVILSIHFEGTLLGRVGVQEWMLKTVEKSADNFDRARLLGFDRMGNAGLVAYGSPVVFGWYLSFNGSTGLRHPDDYWDETTIQGLVVRFRVNDRTGTQVIYKNGDEVDGWGIYFHNNAFGVIAANSSTLEYMTISASIVPLGIWLDVYVTQTELRLYETISGKLLAVTSGTFNSGNGSNHECFAYSGDGCQLDTLANTYFFKGDIAEARIFSEDLFEWPQPSEACLYAKIPSLTSGQDEVLNWYYDKSHAPNSTGDVTELTKLLIHSDTYTGDVVFTDSSFQNHPLVTNGDIHHSTVQSKMGASAIRSDGTDDWIQVADHPDFDYSSGKWCIDFWLFTLSAGYHNIIGKNQGISPYEGWYIQRRNTNHIQFRTNNNTAVLTSTNPVCTDNIWHHIAFTYDGTQLRVFVDGVLEGTATVNIQTFAADVAIGRLAPNYSAANLNGYLDEIRFTQGDEIWTTDFTPNTTPYLSGYIGKTGTPVAQQVWDDDFMAVYHMGQNPSVEPVVDSTSRGFDLSIDVGGYTLVKDGSDYHLQFTGGDIKNTDIVWDVSAYTVEFFAKRNPGTVTSYESLMDANNNYDFDPFYYENGDLCFGDPSGAYSSWTGIWTDKNDFHTISFSFPDIDENGTNTPMASLFMDTAPLGTKSCFMGSGVITEINVGNHQGDANPFLGALSELRFSKVERSNAWKIATHHSNTDNLLTFADSNKHQNPLPGWEDHLALTGVISPDDVAVGQTNFPVRVSIGGTSGINGLDTKYIADAYRKAGVWSGTDIAKYEFGTDRDLLAGFLTHNLVFTSNDINQENSAMVFDGSADQNVTLPDELRPVLAASKVTVAFWVKVDPYTAHMGIFGSHYSHEIEVIWRTSNRIYVHSGYSTSYYNHVFAAIDESVWVHFCYVRNLGESTERIYINGALKGTATATRNVTVGTNPLTIGDVDRYSPFRGALSDVMIFDTDLDAHSVKSLSSNRQCQTYKGFYSVALFDSAATDFAWLKGGVLNSIEVAGAVFSEYISFAFTIDHDTYYVYDGTSWRAVASRDEAIHGNAGDSDWYFVDGGTTWAKALNTAESALSKAFDASSNTMPMPILNGLTAMEYDSLFDSATGIFDVAVGLMSETDGNLPEVSKILFNGVECWLSDTYDLEPFDGIITESNVQWSYRSPQGSDHFKVFVMITGDAAWTECSTNDAPIPGITAGMNTVGKKMQFKVEFDIGLVADPEEIGLEVKIN